MKIIKHTFCKRGTDCTLIGKEAIITETIKAIGEPKMPDGSINLSYEPEWYWANVEGRQHKFQKGDLE